MKKALAWVKANALLVWSGVAILLGAIAMVLSRKNQINSPVEAIRVKKEAKVIAQKEALAVHYEDTAADKHQEVVQLEQEIAESKKRVAVKLKGASVEMMSDAEVADLYRKSGL